MEGIEGKVVASIKWFSVGQVAQVTEIRFTDGTAFQIVHDKDTGLEHWLKVDGKFEWVEPEWEENGYESLYR